jgi:hypothetical protein
MDAGSSPQLKPLTLRLVRRPGSLRAQVLEALAEHGQPLRWAITAVAANGELQIEAVLLR